MAILEDHKGILYKIANNYCKQEDDRQDLIQEIIIQLWSSFSNYNTQYKLSTWIYKIALNTAISFYRKNRKYKNHTVRLSAILEPSEETDSSHYDESNYKTLQRHVQELKEVEKAIILLYLDGLSSKEIAEILGITVSNTTTSISRIKSKLKNLMNPKT